MILPYFDLSVNGLVYNLNGPTEINRAPGFASLNEAQAQFQDRTSNNGLP
jgi:hypothetical protein